MEISKTRRRSTKYNYSEVSHKISKLMNKFPKFSAPEDTKNPLKKNKRKRKKRKKREKQI